MPYTDGGTQRFPRILGTGNALYLLMTGARFDAWRAYEIDFLQELVPPGRALPRALELAEAIAESLGGPLSPVSGGAAAEEAIVATLVRFCRRSVGAVDRAALRPVPRSLTPG